jgi:hypothetical protein
VAQGWRTVTLAATLTAVLAGASDPASAAPLRGVARLDGTWTNAWYTELERPKAFTALVVTAEAARAYERPRQALAGFLPSQAGDLGQQESEFNDRGPGLARIRGQIRSSWIVDPPDGRIPWIAGLPARLDLDPAKLDPAANVEDRPTDERCLTATGANAPILNSADTNLIQIVQAKDQVAIVSEKNHDVRIVRLASRPEPRQPPSWAGESVGRWQGVTLVVETTGLRTGVTQVARRLWLSGASRVVERFTRTGPRELTYVFEVEDPALFTRPWRGEMVFRAAEAPLFEYACHEGNYSLPTILTAARQSGVALHPEIPATHTEGEVP